MIDVNSIMYGALYTVNSFGTVVSCGVSCEIFDEINSNPSRTPWAGISIPEYDFTPHRANIRAPWMVSLNIPIYCQVAVPFDRKAGLTELNNLNKIILIAVNCDRTLCNAVDNLVGIQVNLENEYGFSKNKGDYFYTNVITLQTEVIA